MESPEEIAVRSILLKRLPTDIVDDITDRAYGIERVMKKSPKGWDYEGLRLVHNIRAPYPVWGVFHIHHRRRKNYCFHDDYSQYRYTMFRNARFMFLEWDDCKFLRRTYFREHGWIISLQVMDLYSNEWLNDKYDKIREKNRNKYAPSQWLPPRSPPFPSFRDLDTDFVASIIVNPTLKDEHLEIVHDFLDNHVLFGQTTSCNPSQRAVLLQKLWESNNSLARRHFGRFRMWECVNGLSMEDAMALCNDEQREAFSNALATQRSVRLRFAPLDAETVQGRLSSEEMTMVCLNTTMRKELIPLRTGWHMGALAKRFGLDIYNYLTDDLEYFDILVSRKDIFFAKHTTVELDSSQWKHIMKTLLLKESDFWRLDDSVWANPIFRDALLNEARIVTDWIIRKAGMQPHEVRMLCYVTDNALRGRMDWSWDWERVSLKGLFSWSFVEETIDENDDCWDKTMLSWRP